LNVKTGLPRATVFPMDGLREPAESAARHGVMPNLSSQMVLVLMAWVSDGRETINFLTALSKLPQITDLALGEHLPTTPDFTLRTIKTAKGLELGVVTIEKISGCKLILAKQRESGALQHKAVMFSMSTSRNTNWPSATMDPTSRFIKKMEKKGSLQETVIISLQC